LAIAILSKKPEIRYGRRQLSASCEAEATPSRRGRMAAQCRRDDPAREACACTRPRKFLIQPIERGKTAMTPEYGQPYVQRFFGGPPAAVIGRLILLSILVGVILAAIGLDPWNIIDSVRRLILHIWNMGFDAVRWLWRYFLLGAVIVVPIWLVARLMKAPRGR
jgi:hypothetical protein